MLSVTDRIKNATCAQRRILFCTLFPPDRSFNYISTVIKLYSSSTDSSILLVLSLPSALFAALSNCIHTISKRNIHNPTTHSPSISPPCSLSCITLPILNIRCTILPYIHSLPRNAFPPVTLLTSFAYLNFHNSPPLYSLHTTTFQYLNATQYFHVIIKTNDYSLSRNVYDLHCPPLAFPSLLYLLYILLEYTVLPGLLPSSISVITSTSFG